MATTNTTTLADFQNFLAEKNIHIKGAEKMPEIGITRIYYEDPWAVGTEREEVLHIPKNMKLTLARHPNGKVTALNKVSDNYKLVQHHEALYKALEVIIDNNPEFGIPEVALTYMNGGGRMLAKMKFPKAVEIQEGDAVQPEIILTNSADLSKRFTLLFGAFRLVCSNGLVVPDERFPNFTQIRSLHKNGTLDLCEAIVQLKVGMESFSETIGLWQSYGQKELSRPEWENIMEGTKLSVNQVKEIQNLQVTGWGKTVEGAFLEAPTISAWQAYNAATEWITKNTANEQTQMDRGVVVSRIFEQVLARA